MCRVAVRWRNPGGFHVKVKVCIALMDRSMTELRSVTCHMGSQSVTCHPTQATAPRLNPSHADWYSIYLPRKDGRLSWPCYSVAQPPGFELATSRSRIQRPNHWATTQLVGSITRFVVRPSVWLHATDAYGLKTGKENSVRSITKMGVNVAYCKSNRRADLQFKGWKVKVTGWQKPQEIDTHFIAQNGGLRMQWVT